MKIEEKAAYFGIALTDVYKDEEHRGLYAVPEIRFSSDPTEDFTAMLLAVRYVYEVVTGDKESDLIDFTHILNKLAVQYIMEGMDNNESKNDG